MIAARNADGVRVRTLVRIAVGGDDPTASSDRALSGDLRRLGIEHAFGRWPGVAHEPLPLLRAMGDARLASYRLAFARE
ncbi:MAG: hypothetical protein ACOY82_13640 [Pseudomonadota bacterium]